MAARARDACATTVYMPRSPSAALPAARSTFAILAAALAPAALAPAAARAQVTTGALTGRVTGPGGAGVPNVAVLATLLATGERYGAQTGEDGRYTLANLKPGGPYRVETRRIGFRPDTRAGVAVTLGQSQRLDFSIAESATTLSEVTVTAAVPGSAINAQRRGPETDVDARALQNLPTLSRSLQDMTRLTPTGNANSFAGTNFRYNNITIDGAANNDVFSFSSSYGGVSGTGPSGTPGAGAKSQPISLDAIDQVQVSIAPYDVRLGNFQGASVNAVTRSGTNDVGGSVYSFGRNQSLTGKSADDARTAIPAYHDYQVGGRIGGPIRRDKAFFFGNVEVARRHEPLQFAPGDPGTVIDAATARALNDAVAARLGTTSGAIGPYSIDANSTKLFGRLDFNLSDAHKLNVRNNYVRADAGQLTRGVLNVNFGSQDFTQRSTNNSTVAELRSTFGGGLANTLVAAVTVTRDRRDPNGAILPQVEISGLPSGAVAFLGTNREAAIFRVNTNQFELTDNLTRGFGRHSVTLGTHNEFYKIGYYFQNAWNGRWQYPSLARFYADQPSRVRGTYYAAGSNDYATVSNVPAADFKVLWPSAYLQDDFAVTDRLRVTGGVRVDVPVFPDRFGTNADFLNTTVNGARPFARFAQDKIATKAYVAPRASFNWDARGDQTLQVRGGSGIFVSRIPFAWPAYAYYNNGVRFRNVDLRPAAVNGQPGVVTLVPGAQLSTLQANVYEANVIDPNFKLPTANRSSLGVDYKLPTGTTLTAEGTYSKVLQDVKFLNLGLKDSTVASPIDGRPIFLGATAAQRVNPNVTSVFYLTNTTQGNRYSLTGQVQQSLKALRASVAYTYGQSRDVANGIRNSPQSNWEYNQTTDPRNPGLALSNFDVRQRVVGSLLWNHDWKPGYSFGFSAVYSGVSGAPFSYVYNADFNRDGSGNNDLIYVPRDLADARIVPSAADLAAGRTAQSIWNDLNAFIAARPELDKYRGQVAPRNVGRTPWNHQIDLRLSQDLPYAAPAGRRVQLTLDVINFGAALGRTFGRQYFVPNENNYNVYALNATQSTGPGGAPSGFSFTPFQGNKPYQYDPLASRYQAQLGARVSF